MAISANVFHKGAETIFKVFAEIAHSATYVTVAYNDFEGESPVETSTTIEVIMDTFSERDVQFLSFSALLQPTDIKGLVRGTQLSGVEMGTNDKVVIDSVDYHVIAYSTDPAGAVYTLALRRV